MALRAPYPRLRWLGRRHPHWDLSSPTAGTTTPPQILLRAMLFQAHDSNVWAMEFHPLRHLLVSASNDHTTCFWAHLRPGDAASSFALGGAKPAAVALDDDADGDQYDEDDALAVPGSAPGAGMVGFCRSHGRPRSWTYLWTTSFSASVLM